MGYLRLLLATIIMVHHIPLGKSDAVIPAELAFRTFFIISGYGVASYFTKLGMPINWQKIRTFYTRRIHALYPLYLVTLISLVFLYWVSMLWFKNTTNNTLELYKQAYYYLPFPQNLYAVSEAILRNLTLLGTTNYFVPFSISPPYLLMTQVWTLQLQMIFYVISPLFMQTSFPVLGLAFVLSLLMHGLLTPVITQTKPYTYAVVYFFLYYLHTFLYGILLQKSTRIIKFPKILYFVATILFFVLILSQFFLLGHQPDSGEIALWYMLLVVVLPNTSVFDRLPYSPFLAKMAYPVFLFHLAIEKIVLHLIHQKSFFSSVVIYSATFLLAFVVTLFLDHKKGKLPR